MTAPASATSPSPAAASPAIGSFTREQAGEVIDCTGLHILPGVVDSQVHLREPGAEHKEDLETGGRAAVMGGVTGVFEMPNTSPLTTTPKRWPTRSARATNRMYCDFAFYMGGTRENAHHPGRARAASGLCRRQGVHGLLHGLAAGRGR